MFNFPESAFQAFEEAQDALEQQRYSYGYPGKPVSGGYVYPSSTRAGMIYFRMGREDQFTVVEAFPTVSTIYDPKQLHRLKVIEGVLTVDMPVPSIARQLYGERTVDAQGQQFVRTDRIIAGLVRPSGRGDMVLIIEPYAPGGLESRYELDVSASVPGTTNQRRWGKVYIDTSGVPQIANGTAVLLANNAALTVEAARDITIPIGAYALFAVSFYNGQTSITTDNTRFIDLRDWLNQTTPLNNYAATTAPTVNDDSADGYSVGSLWIDTVGGGVYTCTDATAGAAVWSQGGGGGGAETLVWIGW